MYKINSMIFFKKNIITPFIFIWMIQIVPGFFIGSDIALADINSNVIKQDQFFDKTTSNNKTPCDNCADQLFWHLYVPMMIGAILGMIIVIPILPFVFNMTFKYCEYIDNKYFS